MNSIQKMVKDDRTIGRAMVMVREVIPLINNFLLFLNFFVILNLQSTFLCPVFLTLVKVFVKCPRKVLSKELFVECSKPSSDIQYI